MPRTNSGAEGAPSKPRKRRKAPAKAKGRQEPQEAPQALPGATMAQEPAAVWVPLEQLQPWPRNPRRAQPVAKVADSIKRWGWGSVILARPDGQIIAGHTRYQAAQRLGLERVPVRYLDLSPAEAHALALADNRLGELALWDEDGLGGVLDDLAATDTSLEGLGWTQAELDKLLARVAGPGGEPGPEPVITPPERPHSKAGELYQLGPHRLLCGDCTDPASWEQLLAEDDGTVDLVLTDPPYCSGGSQEAGKAAGSVGRRSDAMAKRGQDELIAWDSVSTRGYQALLRRVLDLAPTGVLYVFTDWRMWITLYDVVEAAGFGVRNMVVWDKGSAGMGVGWRSQHELILAAVKVRNPYLRSVAQGNVIQAQRTRNVHHTTEKPTDLLAKVIEVTANARTVADPFAGSGSTLIACAHTGREARLLEVSPAHCDVARRRWTAWANERGIDPGPGALG